MTPQNITSAVQRLYDTYPFPSEPLLDSPPPGYNWRWCTAIASITGQTKAGHPYFGAGCGTGVGTEYLVHLNPTALWSGLIGVRSALAVARERCTTDQKTNVESSSIISACTIYSSTGLI